MNQPRQFGDLQIDGSSLADVCRRYGVKELPLFGSAVRGQPAMEAIVDGTSLSAASLGLGDRIGTLAPGFDPDIIAIEGDPLQDVTAVRHVVFVMKGGKVWRNEAWRNAGNTH